MHRGRRRQDLTGPSSQAKVKDPSNTATLTTSLSALNELK